MVPRKRQPYGQWTPDSRALDVIGGKWTLLIVRDLSTGPQRFGALRERLPGISTEQLRIRLAEMTADGLVQRRRFREMPPRVEYSLTERGEDLHRVIGAIAEWGTRWTWGPPREGERIDVPAMLRVLAAIPPPAGSPTGTLELRVGDDAFTCVVAEDRLVLRPGAPERHDAVVSGQPEAWEAALRPHGELSAVRITGDRRLAAAFLRRDGAAPD